MSAVHRPLRAALACALGFAFVALAVWQVLALLASEAGPQQVDRTREPFVAGLRGRAP